VLVLSIDTCDARGSAAVLREGAVLAQAAHEASIEYSSWLLPAVAGVLKEAGIALEGVDGYAVASGPGSFTGVRVGLTTVKAWAEVYAKPVAPVSRLEAMAWLAPQNAAYVATFVDAQRGQVFGAVYRQEEGALTRVSDEMVIAPGKFVEEAVRLAGDSEILWLSPDGAQMAGEGSWKEREARGEEIESVSAVLAPAIGRIGARLLREGKVVDALTLDANYVRRSDAEIFWKGSSAAHGR
jgi:tRNA threonylcarbamoyladenosine biosynthesis protein TsaB